MLFTWPYDTVYMLVAIWTVWPERHIRRRSRLLPLVQDRRSSRVINIGGACGALTAMLLAWVIPSAAMPAPYFLFWAGVGAIVASSLLRRHCVRMLGESFTAVVHVVAGQAVVERGAYRWIRHPAYSAGALAYVGVGLALGNWASLVVLLATCSAIYTYRVGVEERALVATLGEAYQAYMRRTKRFIPFLY